MKIAVLWTRLSGYLNACLKELASREGVELFVTHQAHDQNAPFEDAQFGWIANRLMWHSREDLDSLQKGLEDYRPDILIFSGWNVPAYRRAARELEGKCWRVMTMDNCWRATMKQQLAVLSSPFFLKPIADAVWLPGERQAVFARKLGFGQEAILRGLYCCDQTAFEPGFHKRVADGLALPHSFLYVGRFAPEKGLGTLVEAYRAYRKLVPDPWPLICCGNGPLQAILEGQPGIRIEGFVQPEKLPEVLSSAGCLVLASDFEPWAVVIHEAASAGLPILASEKVGAAVHLVQPGYNGFIFGNGDAAGLAHLMVRVSGMSDARRDAMSRASHSLAKQFSPKLWADTLTECWPSSSS